MELKQIYSTRRMGAHRVDHRFRQPQKHGFYQVLDEFSIPEAYLFSAMIQYFTQTLSCFTGNNWPLLILPSRF